MTYPDCARTARVTCIPLCTTASPGQAALTTVGRDSGDALRALLAQRSVRADVFDYSERTVVTAAPYGSSGSAALPGSRRATRFAPGGGHLCRVDGGQRRLASENADDFVCCKVADRVDGFLGIVGGVRRDDHVIKAE